MSDLATPPVLLSKEFPAGLLEWAGNRSGGVRKPFFEASGRPCKVVIETPLLLRLRKWAADIALVPDTPRSVFLVGGPGNGKTEAVEDTIRALDQSLGLADYLTIQFTSLFDGNSGQPIPRLAKVELPPTQRAAAIKEVCVVQDASVTDSACPQQAPAELLVRDLGSIAMPISKSIFLICVNRGILDDALTFASEKNLVSEQNILETIIRSVGLTPAAPSCWPLEGFPHVAVWPMDVETLIWTSSTETKGKSPAEQLLSKAIDATRWPDPRMCVAGDYCPFCQSRAILAKEPQKNALLQTLRWYELATGKRWSFRDLFSLLSYLLAGSTEQNASPAYAPCDWAAHLHELTLRSSSSRTDVQKLRAPFLLASSLYQHALFSVWPRINNKGLRPEIRELEIYEDPGLMGLHYFLTAPRDSSVPSTLKLQLFGLADCLDPALAEPLSKIEIEGRVICFGKDIDARFSQSVGEGLSMVRPHLSVLEIDLLDKLARTDEVLSSPSVRRRRPATARRVQNLIREFSCRFTRRSLGARYGVTREQDILADFEKVTSGNTELLHKAVKQVEALINSSEQFEVVLNSTFGEPLVRNSRRATIRIAKQKVKPVGNSLVGRPMHSIPFLLIGGRGHPLALTYELFRSVRELESGMLPASLPRPVVALLDTTRARLSGAVVRDEDLLDGAEIKIGNGETIISREFGKFVISKEKQP